MNEGIHPDFASTRANRPADGGVACLCAIASYFRIPSDPERLHHELALGGRAATSQDLLRAARILGLKARIVAVKDASRLESAPVPAIVQFIGGRFEIFGGRTASGSYRVVDPLLRHDHEISKADALAEIEPFLLLVTRRRGGAGIDPNSFGFRWFLESIGRYRKPLSHVLVASFFVQIFALVTPLFFQVIVDKVLTHKSYATLLVLVVGLIVIGLFDVVLQFLRSYALAHTTNRIDVELGQRLFHQLLRLPLAYFETRSAGQTVARVRELENIRQFLTGQALFAVVDAIFAVIFVLVLFAYSWSLALIVLGFVPIYVLVAAVLRPPLRELVKEKFARGAASQQFLVESVVGIHTIKASAVEPVMQVQWEDRLAAYVRTAFRATILAASGQNLIQYLNKLTTALILLFGAKAVIDGNMTVGELIAFNMIAGQVALPVLRLSQLWQDFQQVQVSVERVGDILNTPMEAAASSSAVLPTPRGAIEFRNVSFRYVRNMPPTLKNVSLAIRPGEVIGIIGPSGSGKSTLAKLIQRLYVPEEGQVLVDGADISQVDPAWLRHNIGIVLQENLLFNRTIHENIAFADPAMPRGQVIGLAQLAGADEFINKLPEGYDSVIEERGANLSGGQRQRIAIARALAPNPPVLIFDEATSALDYESERVIQNNMRHIVRNRTVIIIAHRLAAVRHCDRIVAMVDGRIIEAGGHDELLKVPGGLYARLWVMQRGEGAT